MPGIAAVDPRLCPDPSQHVKTGARITVWGFGRHGGGAAAVNWCAARGAQVRIVDAQPAQALGPQALSMASQHSWAVGDAHHPWLIDADLLVVSPAIPPRQLPQNSPPITVPEGLALSAHRGRRVLVTGTKGKSTTTTTLAGLLSWPACGNGWEPLPQAVDRLGPTASLVMEISSFQAWYLAAQAPSMDAAILTSLSQDHLDWHRDLDDYQLAKRRALSWAPVLACPPHLDSVETSVQQTSSNTSHPTRLLLPRWVDDQLWWHDHPVAHRQDFIMPGLHLANNAALAVAVALHLGLAPEQVAGRLRTVQALPHRLETVWQQDGCRYVNDSIATMPEATICALDAIAGPLAVLLGGSDKGADYTALAQHLARRPDPTFAICLGSTGPRLYAACCQAGVKAHLVADLSAAFPVARQVIRSYVNATILLSPACASFDQFSGYEERGRIFALLAASSGPGVNG